MPFVLKSSREYLLLVSDHRLIGSRMDWINSPRSGRRCRRSSRSSWSSSTHSSLRYRAWRRMDQTDRDELHRELHRLSGRLAGARSRARDCGARADRPAAAAADQRAQLSSVARRRNVVSFRRRVLSEQICRADAGSADDPGQQSLLGALLGDGVLSLAVGGRVRLC